MKNKILNNVNFEISKGDVVGIIGEICRKKHTNRFDVKNF